VNLNSLLLPRKSMGWESGISGIQSGEDVKGSPRLV
jgi:hypothetical protein